MSKEERKVSPQDIEKVQNLIERCLQLYMSQSEVVRLLDHEKIEPGFTELVWQNLEAENKEFFRAYHLRCKLKDQIMQFNQLLEKQVELTRNVSLMGDVPVPMSNRPHIHSMHNAAFRAPEPLVPLGMRQMIGGVPNIYANRINSLQSNMHVNMPGHVGRVDVPSNLLLGQSSNAGMMQGFNGVAIQSNGNCAGNSPIMFAANNNLLQPCNGIGGASISPFQSAGLSRHALSHQTMMDPRMNSFEFLGQMNQNTSLPGLTANFPSTDVQESYPRPPFLGMDAGFLNPRNSENQAVLKRLDNKSEGFSYKDFSSC